MKQTTKDPWGEGSRMGRLIRRVRQAAAAVRHRISIPHRWMPRREHRLHVHFAQGAVYGFGSGAVGLLILWIRHIL